jgi:hypothetical protein
LGCEPQRCRDGSRGEAHDVFEAKIAAHDGEAVGDGVTNDMVVGLTAQSTIADILRGESGGVEPWREGSREVFIDQEPRHLRNRAHFLRGQARGKLTEYDIDRHAGALDQRLAKAHALVNHDPWSELDHLSAPLSEHRPSDGSNP